MDNQSAKRIPAAIGVLAALSLLLGCSSVGPGFINHPGDCAIGIPWADCLPGTPGYNNGGGRVHREAVQQQNAAIEDQFKSAKAQCMSELQTPDLDPIRHKVELNRDSADAPVPFEFAANDEFPTEPEHVAIARWATIRDGCIKRASAISNIPPNANALTATLMRQEGAFRTEIGAWVGELIVALYHAKLTYGEFAQKRYQIGKSGEDAAKQFRQTALIQDQQRQMQAQQLAQQQFQNNLMAWSVYMQSVSARQPETVHLNSVSTHCTSVRTGDFVNTDCY
jgi:hypothetical protein